MTRHSAAPPQCSSPLPSPSPCDGGRSARSLELSASPLSPTLRQSAHPPPPPARGVRGDLPPESASRRGCTRHGGGAAAGGWRRFPFALPLKGAGPRDAGESPPGRRKKGRSSGSGRTAEHPLKAWGRRAGGQGWVRNGLVPFCKDPFVRFRRGYWDTGGVRRGRCDRNKGQKRSEVKKTPEIMFGLGCHGHGRWAAGLMM